MCIVMPVFKLSITCGSRLTNHWVYAHMHHKDITKAAHNNAQNIGLMQVLCVREGWLLMAMTLIKTLSPAQALPYAPLGSSAGEHLLPSVVSYRLAYQQLFDCAVTTPNAALDQLAEQILAQQIHQTAAQPDDLPAQPNDLMTWMHAQHQAVGERYQAYRATRSAGQPRQMFASTAHALLWLRDISPTKLVDGAWLAGLLPYWQDPQVEPLIRTYLDELGNGQAADHHVLIYQRLLAQWGIRADAPSDAHYIQGAVQLALGRLADRYWPEVLGFHLGYEQLPLHLLISQFELNELGIDPYYFSLHVTIDNADSGHAHQAVCALMAALPVLGDRADFWQRVKRGYRLNAAGLSAQHIAQSIDLQHELVQLLARKGRVGQYAHADYCRIAGQSINQWLADPTQAADLLWQLEQSGWITRDQAPEHSRFWRLIDGAQSDMFGVFTLAEKQLWRDWITGDAPAEASNQAAPVLTYRQRRRAQQTNQSAQPDAANQHINQKINQNTSQGTYNTDTCATSIFAQDADQLDQQLACLDEQAYMQHLSAQLSPNRSTHALGLQAARLFLNRLNTGSRY